MRKIENDELDSPEELERFRPDHLNADEIERMPERCRDSKLSSRKLLIGGAAVSILTLLILIVILTLVFFPWQVDQSLFLPTRHCKGDGFSVLYYNHTDKSENVAKRFFKYKYIEDIENDKLYNFTEAKDKCKELNSTLWEILDGPEEWEAVIGMAREKDLTGIWLNARVTGSCPSDQVTCLEAEAEEGRGLSVRWPSSRHSKYSRLRTPVLDDANCVHVDKMTDELLWITGLCSKNGFWGLCVKRDCFPE